MLAFYFSYMRTFSSRVQSLTIVLLNTIFLDYKQTVTLPNFPKKQLFSMYGDGGACAIDLDFLSFCH